MPDSPKPDESTNQGNSERRSARIFISIPIRISGKDGAGQTFTENAKTLVVNRHGAKIVTTKQLSLGCELTVENPHLARTANGKVVWLREQRSPSDSFEAALEIAESPSLFGIDFPSDSWQDGPPLGPGGQRLDKATPSAPIKTTDGSSKIVVPLKPPTPAAVAKLAALESAETPQFPLQPASSAVGDPHARDGHPSPVLQPKSSMATPVEGAPPTLAPATPSTDGPVLPGATIEGAVARLIALSQSATEPLVKPSERRLTEPSQVRAETQTGPKDAGKSINQLEAQLRASRDEMQALVSRFQELKRMSEVELTNARRSIGAGSVQAVKAATREIQERVRDELERSYSALVEKGREQLQVEASTILADLSREASLRLANLTEEFFSKLRPEAQGVSKQIAKSVEQLFRSESDAYQEKLAGLSASSLEGIQNQADVLNRGLTEHAQEAIQTVKAELCAAGKELIDGTEERIHAAVQAGVDSLSTEVQTTSGEYRQHLSEALQEFRERTALELQSHFQQTSRKTQAAKELLDRDIRDLMGEALTQVKDDLHQRVTEASGAVEAQLASATVKLTGWEEQILARLREHSEKLDIEARAVAGELHEQTEALSQSVLEELRSQVDQLLADMQGRLEKAANAFHDREMQVIRAKFYTAMNELVESTGAKLRKKSEESVELANEQLREKQQQAVSEGENLFRDRLAGILRAVMQVVVQPRPANPSHQESEAEPADKDV